MTRIVPLPAVEENLEMPSNEVRQSIGNIESLRRQSALSSSDPFSDSLPIDCILVYDRTESGQEADSDSNHQRKKHKNPAERRQKFEEYLSKKQGLVLKHVESKSTKIGFVKVHTPFEILLVTAENMRMRLPIEKIEENEDDLSTTQTVQSTGQRFFKWVKRPFRLDSSLKQNDLDYYTAIYSSNIDKFQYLFETLRGSKDSYFTPTERSLLTHELLSRAHFDYDDDDDIQEEQTSNSIVAIADVRNETRKGSRRPGINRLVAKKAYACYFPLHERLRDNVTNVDDGDLNDREKLRKHWATMRQCFKFQPLSLIRSYMGEKVAFYFAMSGFYNQMLFAPAIVGLIIFIYGAASVFSDRPTSDICGDFGKNTLMCPRCDKQCPYDKLSSSCVYSKISYVFDNAATLVFAILMSLWARWFVEFWKRRQAVLQYDWDSIDFEEHLEPVRPEFEIQTKRVAEKRVNPVTGIKEPYVSARKRFPFFLITIAVVVLMISIVCVTVFATIVYRVQMTFFLQERKGFQAYTSIIITVTSAIMNLICSVIFSQLYYFIARKLTDLELHKYQSKYDDSMILKIYLFQFVNFYSSLFYIAFFKGRFLEYPSKYGEPNSKDFTEQCDPAGCLVELSIQLLIIMVGKQLINNLLEFFYAMRRTLMRVCFDRRETDAEEQWEKDNQLFDFTSNTLIDEYLELVIQFGFVTLFVAAFPLAPLFALFNNLIEIRLDAWKFLSKYKRPIPFKASDIGIWSDIISGISYLAVLTNAIVIAWTSEFIPKMAYRTVVSQGQDLVGYVNWTLSSFPLSSYNSTNTVPEFSPQINSNYCRYRDFREQTDPFNQTSTYWNVIAARLAFIIVFENLVFFIVYIMQWVVPDVPQTIQNNIDHERFIDQRERWTSKTTEDNFKDAVIASEAISKILNSSNVNKRTSIDQINHLTNEIRHRKEQNHTHAIKENDEVI